MNAHLEPDRRLPRRRGRPVALALALVLVAATAAASAHPYDPGYYSLRSALRVDDSRGLQLMAVAEVPNMDMLAAFARRFGTGGEYEQSQIDGFIASYFDIFARGLSVEVEGEPLPGRWVPLDDPRNGRVGEEGLFIFMLRFVPETQPPLDAERLEVLVHMESFEGEEAFFSGSVEALAPWRVVESTARDLLGEISGTEDVNECFECWSREEALRHPRALFERRGAADSAGTRQGGVTQP